MQSIINESYSSLLFAQTLTPISQTQHFVVDLQHCNRASSVGGLVSDQVLLLEWAGWSSSSSVASVPSKVLQFVHRIFNMCANTFSQKKKKTFYVQIFNVMQITKYNVNSHRKITKIKRNCENKLMYYYHYFQHYNSREWHQAIEM